MNIKIRMISGKEYIFENNKYKNIDDWIRGNFDTNKQFFWFAIAKEHKVRLNFNNIELVEEM